MEIPVINMTLTAMNIRNLRINAGLSVKALQDILGFSTPQSIYKWQQGATLPSLDNLVILASVLHVTMDEIVITDMLEV